MVSVEVVKEIDRLRVEIKGVKTEYVGNYTVLHTAIVKISYLFDSDYYSKVVKKIKQDMLEFLPDDVGDEEMEEYIKKYVTMEEFKKTFTKELINELKVEYEVHRRQMSDEEIVLEIIFREKFFEDLVDEREIIQNLDEYKRNFVDEIIDCVEMAIGNTTYTLAEKISKRLLLDKLKEEVYEEEDKESEEEQSKEEPIEELKRAIIVASKNLYITLPKSYLKHLYKKYGRVPKWVRFKYYRDGKIVIEPIWDLEEIPKEKLEWLGITKL